MSLHHRNPFQNHYGLQKWVLQQSRRLQCAIIPQFEELHGHQKRKSDVGEFLSSTESSFDVLIASVQSWILRMSGQGDGIFESVAYMRSG